MVKSPISNPGHKMRRGMMAAVVLGTALTAFGAVGAAPPATPDATLRAVEDISRYCTSCWRNARLAPDCWNDCTQDVFIRLLERVNLVRWGGILETDGEDRRELIRAIDAVKKRNQRQHRHAALVADNVPDRRIAESDDRSVVDQIAGELLTVRQQRILRLSFEGATVQEIASELELPPDRVSDEKYKAIRKLRTHLGERDVG
jgi:RNA polymerase sigma factor (sigma-70 family)